MTFPTITEARQVLQAGAPRALWHATRRQGIGGSDALAALGLSVWSSPYKLWLEKTGRLPPAPSVGRLEWGTRLEPLVADWFADLTGLQVKRTGTWQRLDTPWAMCNPDRLTSDGALLETKTVSTHSPDLGLWKVGLPDYPEAQVQWCLGVTGLERAWAAGLPDGADAPIIREVYRDNDLIAELFAANGEFWREYVLADRPPPVDDSAVTGAALGGAAAAFVGPGAERELGAELETWVAERARLKAATKELAARCTGVENRIKAALAEGAEYGTVGGVRRVRLARRTQTSTDVELLREQYPEVWERVKRSTPYVELRVVSPNTEAKRLRKLAKDNGDGAWNAAPQAPGEDT